MIEDYSEGLCRRCGRCCKIKNRINKTQFYEHKRDCEHLRTNRDGTTTCVRYSQKDRTGFCTNAKEGVELGVMPVDCPYTKNKKNYKRNIINKKDD